MKRIWLVLSIVALAGVAKFGYEYFYFDQKALADSYKNPTATILVLPDAPADSISAIKVTPKGVQQALLDLGIPAGKVDGKWGQRTRQGFCIWRELTGRDASRDYPIEFEQREIMILAATKAKFILGEDYVRGLNVNKTCQNHGFESGRAHF